MTTAPPPARQRFNPRGRAAALPSSYTTTWDTTGVAAGGTAKGLKWQRGPFGGIMF